MHSVNHKWVPESFAGLFHFACAQVELHVTQESLLEDGCLFAVLNPREEVPHQHVLCDGGCHAPASLCKLDDWLLFVVAVVGAAVGRHKQTKF